jgi:hypothetical protein
MRGSPRIARAKPLCEGLKLLGFGRNGLAGCHIIDEGMSARGRSGDPYNCIEYCKPRLSSLWL